VVVLKTDRWLRLWQPEGFLNRVQYWAWASPNPRPVGMREVARPQAPIPHPHLLNPAHIALAKASPAKES